MNKKLLNIITTVFLGVFFATIYNTATKKPETPDHKIHQPAKLENELKGFAIITDGDSIKINNERIRLLGIDAPEYSQTCFNAKKIEYNCGQISRNFLINLANNKEVTCYYAQKDIYNRFLAECFIGEISINQEIIKNGMAVIYNFKASDEIMENLETQAKINKIGIWQGAFQLPKDYRKANKKKKHK